MCSVLGTSRQFAATQHFGRFRSAKRTLPEPRLTESAHAFTSFPPFERIRFAPRADIRPMPCLYAWFEFDLARYCGASLAAASSRALMASVDEVYRPLSKKCTLDEATLQATKRRVRPDP